MEKRQLSLSIIIPVYNVEKYINRCLDSIIQFIDLNMDVEIICVDDGSKDGSGGICDWYSEKYQYVKVIHKENGGLSDARNCGLKKASKEYICFFDSDDYILGNVFKRFNDIKQVIDIDIYQFGYKATYESIEQANEGKDYCVLKKQEAYRTLLNGASVTRMAWDKIYKKALFADVEYPFGFIAEDYGTTYKLIYNVENYVVDNNVYYGYFQRDDSIMASKSYKLAMDEYLLGEEFYDFNKKNMSILKKEYNSEHINLLMKTYTRLLKYNNKNKKNILKSIRKEINELLIEKTKARTKFIQIAFIICRPIALFIITKKDKSNSKKIKKHY